MLFITACECEIASEPNWTVPPTPFCPTAAMGQPFQRMIVDGRGLNKAEN